MLRVRVVGGLELERDGEPLPAPGSRPARALLGWLATHPGTHPRGAVAAALWPDVRDESARASLRTALSAVRDALGDGAEAVLVSDRQRVGLAGGPAVAVDLSEFDSLLDQGRLADAVAAGSGELLPDLDADWVLRARDRHRERLMTAMSELAAAAEASGDRASSIAWLRRRTEEDPFDEPAHRDLMAALGRAGDRAGALATYQRLTDRLRRELAVAPSAATRSLAASLRAEEPVASGATSAGGVRRLPVPQRLGATRWRRTFVGRADALARLGVAWTSAQARGFGCALILGEPGIGKTRLAAHFAGELHAGGATILAGSSEEESPGPYRPIVDALQAAAQAGATSGASGLLDDGTARARLHEQLATALERASAGRPLCLVLDDLHWADPDTLTFLRSLARRGLSVPTFVLATARPGALDAERPLGQTIGAIARETAMTWVELAGLGVSDTAALVADRAAGDAADVDIDAIVARTGGNPFFVEALLDAGLTAPGASLPAGVAELVAGRVQALGPSVTAVLEAAATLGLEFDVELAGITAQIEREETIAALDAAADARLLALVGEHAGRMAFAHALVQEALTARLPPGRRAALHAAAAEALGRRALSGSDEALTAAARHAVAAMPAIDVERVAALAEQAGFSLIAAQAPTDAAELLERALRACEDAGAPVHWSARLRLALGDALQRCDRNDDAARACASALSHARRIGDARLLARAALGVVGPAVAIAGVDNERVTILGEALDALAPDEPELRARVQARLAFELAYSNDPEDRDRLSAEALSAARALEEPRTLAAALGARHVSLWGPDHTTERLPLADEMLALARRAEDPALELQARTWRIVDLEELGDGAGVDSELDAYAATATRSRLSAYAWYVAGWRAARSYLAGDVETARRLQGQAVRLGRQARDPNVQFVQRLHLIHSLADESPDDLDFEWQAERVRTSTAGWAYRAMSTWALAAAGRTDEARHELALQRRAGAPQSWPRDTNWLSAAKELSEAAAILGERDLGAELTELLAPFSDRIVVSARAFMCIGSVAGALARLAQLRGELDAAIDFYEQAIERAERVGALIWAVNHRWRLAGALAAAGRTDHGRLVLDRVRREAPALGLSRLGALARDAPLAAMR